MLASLKRGDGCREQGLGQTRLFLKSGVMQRPRAEIPRQAYPQMERDSLSLPQRGLIRRFRARIKLRALIPGKHAVVGGTIANVMPSHPLSAAIVRFEPRFAIDATGHRNASRHVALRNRSGQSSGLFKRRASRYYEAFRRRKLQQGFS